MSSGSEANGTKSDGLGRVLAVIGAGAAAAGWVAVVGGAREWARFRAAGVPSPAETASLFPREALVGEGLSALAPLLLLGLGLSAPSVAQAGTPLALGTKVVTR